MSNMIAHWLIVGTAEIESLFGTATAEHALARLTAPALGESVATLFKPPDSMMGSDTGHKALPTVLANVPPAVYACSKLKLCVTPAPITVPAGASTHGPLPESAAPAAGQADVF
jgi:hypothetical protein